MSLFDLCHPSARSVFFAIIGTWASVSSAWAAPFSPSSVTGLELWLDANASLNSGTPSNGSSVALWVDRSGQGRDASQATSSNQPVFVSDNGIGSSMPAIRFDGSNDSMSFTQFLPRSAFIVNKTTGGAHSLAGILGKFPNGTGIRRSNAVDGWHHPGDGNVFTNPVGSGFFVNGTSGNLVNKHVWHIMSAIRSTASTVEFNTLGKAYAGREWAGDIAEVLIYDSTLGESDRQKIEGYLAHKWGMVPTLPSNHPYLSSLPSTNAAPTGAVTISGTATQHQTLTAVKTLADADGLGAITYQWKRESLPEYNWALQANAQDSGTHANHGSLQGNGAFSGGVFHTTISGGTGRVQMVNQDIALSSFPQGFSVSLDIQFDPIDFDRSNVYLWVFLMLGEQQNGSDDWNNQITMTLYHDDFSFNMSVDGTSHRLIIDKSLIAKCKTEMCKVTGTIDPSGNLIGDVVYFFSASSFRPCDYGDELLASPVLQYP